MVPSTNLLTRRGENDFHGNLWEFLRNDVFNANAFFRNATGQPKPNLKQNQFGATLGGPVKEQVFFFGSYQGTRQVNGLDPTSVANLILPRLAATAPPRRSPRNSAPAITPRDTQVPHLRRRQATRLPEPHHRRPPRPSTLSPSACCRRRAPTARYLIPSPQTLITPAAMPASASRPTACRPPTGRITSLANTRLRPDVARRTRSPAAFSPPPSTSFEPSARPADTRARPSSRLGCAAGPSRHRRRHQPPAHYDAHRQRRQRSRHGLHAQQHRHRRGRHARRRRFGMTAVDPLFPQPPEITVLGPMGTFRLSAPTPTTITSKPSPTLGRITCPGYAASSGSAMGGFFLNQYNGRADTGGARGKITFQTFADFLLGLERRRQPEPLRAQQHPNRAGQRRRGPQWRGGIPLPSPLWRRLRAGRHQAAARASPSISACAGSTSGPRYDTAGTIGNAWPPLLARPRFRLLSGTLVGNTVAANYDPALVNPYTGKPFGPPPEGVLVRSTNSFYENGTPRDQFAPRAGFAWQPLVGQPHRRRRRLWLVLPDARLQRKRRRRAAVHLRRPSPRASPIPTPVTICPPSSSRSPPPPSGYVPRTPSSQLSDRVAGPEYQIPRLQQWNLSLQMRLTQDLSLDLGYVGSHGVRLLLSHGLNQPLLASATDPSIAATTATRKLHHHQHVAQRQAARAHHGRNADRAPRQRIRRSAPGITACRPPCAARCRTACPSRPPTRFQSRSITPRVYNDQNRLDLAKGRASFDRTHRMIANFDYQLPAPIHASGFRGGIWNGWSLSGIVIMQSGLPMTLTDPNARRRLRPRRNFHHHHVSRHHLCRLAHVWQRLRPPRSLDRHISHLRPSRRSAPTDPPATAPPARAS